MFLLRTAFWLTVVILILPADKPNTQTSETNQAGYNVNAGSLYTAARNTVSDIASICERNPGVCETGQAALNTFGEKARTGAKMMMDFVSDRTGDSSSSAPQQRQTSQNTLIPRDREPNWGGPLTSGKV